MIAHIFVAFSEKLNFKCTVAQFISLLDVKCCTTHVLLMNSTLRSVRVMSHY